MNQAQRNPALSEYREAKKFIMECPHHGTMKFCFFAQSFLSRHFSPQYPSDGNSPLETARLGLPTLMKEACVLPWLRVFGSLRQPNCWLLHPILLLHPPKLNTSFQHARPKEGYSLWGMSFPARLARKLPGKLCAEDESKAGLWEQQRWLQSAANTAVNSPQRNVYCTHEKALPNYWKTLTNLFRGEI